MTWSCRASLIWTMLYSYFSSHCFLNFPVWPLLCNCFYFLPIFLTRLKSRILSSFSLFHMLVLSRITCSIDVKWIDTWLQREQNYNTWKVSRYGVFLVRIFPPVIGLKSEIYSVRIWANTEQKKLRTWTLFTQCKMIPPKGSDKKLIIRQYPGWYIYIQKMSKKCSITQVLVVVSLFTNNTPTTFNPSGIGDALV